MECIKPTTCCAEECQLCCCDTRFAIPHTKEVPCMLTLLGLTCIDNYTCVCKCMGSGSGHTHETGTNDSEMPSPVQSEPVMDRV